MDRILNVEHPSFAVFLSGGTYTQYVTGFREITQQVYVHEATIDLGGYTRNDLTVYFRNSFEQTGGTDVLFWNSYDPATDAITEVNLVSSVPFTDDQLRGALLYQPGFTPFPLPGADYGNFDRTHIIHGTYKLYYANSIIGASAFGSSGLATLTALTDNNFSSLEPTAADTLYCYRIFSIPDAAQTSIAQLAMPPKRVLMSITTEEEPELSYMMRLKRSYELANQV
tara:strand:- start:40 stop:717 length:678 start_codon:yes stop_codon:yes gene_type:complete